MYEEGSHLSKESKGSVISFFLFSISCLIVFSLMLFGSMRDVVLRFVHDDAFYYLRIASNWYHLHFSTFDGINYTNGYHPLLQWLLVFPSSWFSSMETFMRVVASFGVVLVFLSGILIYKALSSYKNIPISLLWYWLTGSLVFATIYGMESPLTIFILSLLIYFLQKNLLSLNFKRSILYGILSGLLFLSRIDALIWIFALDVVVFAIYIKFRMEHKGLWKLLATFFFVQGSIIIGYFIYNVVVWKHLFTVSAMVKAGRALSFSFAIPPSMLFILAIFITVLGLVILADFIFLYILSNRQESLAKLLLPAWLSFANLLYMLALLVKGGPETYNWYFVTVVFSGGIILPYFIGNYNISIPYSRKYSLAVIFSLMLLVFTVHNKITQPSNFVEAYDRAIDLSKFPERSTVFASTDCGILGTLSYQSCLNLDGLTNSFEFQEALRDNSLADWLKVAGLNTFVAEKDGVLLEEGTLEAPAGMYSIGRKVKVKLSQWDTSEVGKLKSIKLYKVEEIYNLDE